MSRLSKAGLGWGGGKGVNARLPITGRTMRVERLRLPQRLLRFLRLLQLLQLLQQLLRLRGRR